MAAARRQPFEGQAQVCVATEVVEFVTVNRRFMLVLELVRLRLELDLRRPPRSGPEGGRPVERLSSLRNERPHDCAVKLEISTYK